MNDKLYIPNKLKIGFQERSGTYTGKLAYITYLDHKGIHRKEKSWNSWRDKNINPEDYDNIPTEGFVINKDVSRYNWSHFSSGRSYIRIYDPRGFEFEVTPENLIGILMHGDCSRRTLDGKFVYAWSGTDLILLPCNSEEYQSSLIYTGNQLKKLSTKDLIEGYVYRNKKGEDFIYLGKRFKYNIDKCDDNGNLIYFRKPRKVYVFSLLSKDLHYRIDISGLSSMAERVSDSEHPDYVYHMQQMMKEVGYHNITNINFTPTKFNIKIKSGYYPKFEREWYTVNYNKIITIIKVTPRYDYDYLNKKYIFNNMIDVTKYMDYILTSDGIKIKYNSGYSTNSFLSADMFEEVYAVGDINFVTDNGTILNITPDVYSRII